MTHLAQPVSPVTPPDWGRPRTSPKPEASDAPSIRREINADQICILTFDRPDSSANIFDRTTLAELDRHLDFLRADASLKGLVLVSAKKSIFIAGADLLSIFAETRPEALRELIELGQRVFNRIAHLPCPTVAAIHGAALGGGCEIALACDWRVASTDSVTKIGLPETQLGLLPAWGGSTRLPRLIGLPKALEIILAGKSLAPKPALKCGLVDALVPREYLLPTAMKKIREGKPHRASRPFTNNALVAAVIAARAKAQLQKKTRGHYPAVTKALEVVTKGISRSISDSLQLEVEGVEELGKTETTRNLLRLFLLQERAKKLKLRGGPEIVASATLADVEPGFQPGGKNRVTEKVSGKMERFQTADDLSGRQDAALYDRPGGPPPLSRPALSASGVASPAGNCAVIGAGVMGAGIAQWLSAKKLSVILRDVSPEQIARGLSNISKLYAEGKKRHTFTAVEARAGLDRIHPAAAEVPLRNVDFVIEAAVEEMAPKKEIFRKLDALAGEQTILATNTSALSVAEIAAATVHPERVVGIHFFNPVHRMQLVEVVRAPQTSPAAVQRAIQFVQQIGKLPLLVNDSPGFLVNRILIPYLIEAGLLFESGASARDLDEAMLDFGMPMGPLRLLDEVGLDVAHHICGTLAEKFHGRFPVPSLLDKMVKAKMLGRKSGRGFYVHARGKQSPKLNAEAEAFRTGDSARALTREQSQVRMVLLMINEAARCLEERVVASADDVDFGMVMGTGFAPFRGGPLRHADAVGAAQIVVAMRHWVGTGATWFEPCALLQELAERGGKFHSD